MQVLCRPFPGPRLHQVVGKITRIFIEVPGMDPLKRVGDTAMQTLPPHERQPAEKRLADLLMGEDEARPPALLGHQQPGALGCLQGIEQIVLGLLGESRQELKREGPPDTCRGRQDALRGIADAVDAASEHEPDRFRHFDLANLDLGKPFAPRIGQSLLLGQVAIDLLHEERNPFGLGVDQAHQAFGRLLAGQGTQYVPDLGSAHPLERDTRNRLQPGQMLDTPRERVSGTEVDVAIRPDHEQCRLSDAPCHPLQQLRRRLVGPVQVFQRDQHRLDRCRAVEEVAHALEHVVTRLIGRQRQGRRKIRVGDTHLRNETGDLGTCLAHRRPEGIPGHHGQSVLDGLNEWDERRRALHVVALPTDNEHAAGLGLGRDLVDQPRLAKTSLPCDERDASASGQGAVHRLTQQGPFLRPPDVRRATRAGSCLGGRPDGAGLADVGSIRSRGARSPPTAANGRETP